jgi:hypothetical protein
MENFFALIKKLYLKITTRGVILAAVFMSFIACTKNNNANPAILAGTWKLTSSTGSLYNIILFERNDTTIKLTETQTYNSTSAAGFVTFSGNSTSSDSLFVHAVITQNNAEYFNGVLNRDTTTTYGYDQGTINVQSSFEMIGQDSIHFEGLGIPLTAGLQLGGAEGAKFIISGNTLTLNTHIFSIDSSATSVQHRYQTIVTALTRQ